jgi:hypothetical protein
MDVPHYSYLVLKMPTEQGVLTLRGNVYTAYNCEEESFKVAEATDLSIRMEQTLVDASKIPTSGGYGSPSENYKILSDNTCSTSDH